MRPDIDRRKIRETKGLTFQGPCVMAQRQWSIGSPAFAETCNSPVLGLLTNTDADFDLSKFFVEHCNAIPALQERDLVLVALNHYVCQRVRLVSEDKSGSWLLHNVEIVMFVGAKAALCARYQICPRKTMLVLNVMQRCWEADLVEPSQLLDGAEWNAGARADLGISDSVVSTLLELLHVDDLMTDLD